MIAKKKDGFPAAVSSFNASFASLAADWAEYLRGWDADAIEADRAVFAEETIAIMKRLRDRIDEENSLLYPLALAKGYIRLRAA